MQGRIVLPLVLWLPAVLAGCGTMSKSLPARTAQEQLLISTAADRALSRADLKSMKDKKVFVDGSYLQAYDAPYVVGKLRNAIAFHGGQLADTKEDSDVIVEPRSGGLSIDETSFLLGVPPIPLFFLGTGLETPEIPFFKMVTQRGVAKLSVFGYTSDDRKLLFSSGVRFGSSRARSYWVFFLGPFTFNNMPRLPREYSGNVYSLEEPPRAEPDRKEEPAHEPEERAANRTPGPQ